MKILSKYYTYKLNQYNTLNKYHIHLQRLIFEPMYTLNKSHIHLQRLAFEPMYTLNKSHIHLQRLIF